jgi:hypothetical protein
MIDVTAHLAEFHRRELEAVAARRRLVRAAQGAGRRRGPSPLARLYARIWWASRPRARSWAPTLLDPSY